MRRVGQKHYGGMIDWIGPDFGGENVSVNPDAMTLTSTGRRNKVDVCNVIPAMKAGRIADMAGVTDGNWAPVNAADLSSKADADVHVSGRCCAARGHAQIRLCRQQPGQGLRHGRARCADWIQRCFRPSSSNTCWSLIDADDGVKVGATYEATEEKIAKVDGFISQTGEDSATRKATYEESVGWYAGITSDMFG